MRVLGIDPGYDRVGVAIAETQDRRDVVLFSCCIETNPKDAFVARLGQIADRLRQIVQDQSPEVACIETLFFQTNAKTAIRVAEARGMMQYLLHHHGVRVVDIGPGQVKSSITGNGRASKQEVAKMTRLISGIHDIDKRRDDEVDAMAIALAGLHIATSLLPQD